ncbi:cell division protein ZapA, partial [Pseudomonas sp. BAgro211]|nr:cell division protein ZapA [Pseudomonas sp. BAgro211]
ITHDLLHKQERVEHDSGSTRERVRELLERVDRALTTDTPTTDKDQGEV